MPHGVGDLGHIIADIGLAPNRRQVINYLT